MLRALAEAGQKPHRQQVEKPASKTAHTVLRAAEPPRPVVDRHLRDAKALGVRENRYEAVQLTVKPNLRGNFRPKQLQPAIMVMQPKPGYRADGRVEHS